MSTENQTPTPTPTPSPSSAPTPTPLADAGNKLYGNEPPAAAPAPEPAAAAPAAAPAPAEAQPPAAAPAVDPAAPAARTVADYTFDLPEGFQANEPLVGKFRDLALEANLDPAVASKLQGLYVEAAQAQAQQLQTAWTDITTGWHTEVMALPEFAPERREQTTTLIGRLMDEFSTPEDRRTFDESGLGNHPAFVRLVLNLSSALMEGEATPPGGVTSAAGPKGTPASGRKSLGQTIYGE